MIYLIIGLILSVVLNILLAWYVYKVLAKLLYTSDNLGDLYVVFRVYENFVSSMYGMDMFYGEPIIQELLIKTKFVREELEKFEDVYNLTTDIEAIEEELVNDRTEEEEETP
jgi:hypothetical protein